MQTLGPNPESNPVKGEFRIVSAGQGDLRLGTKPVKPGATVYIDPNIPTRVFTDQDPLDPPAQPGTNLYTVKSNADGRYHYTCGGVAYWIDVAGNGIDHARLLWSSQSGRIVASLHIVGPGPFAVHFEKEGHITEGITLRIDDIGSNGYQEFWLADVWTSGYWIYHPTQQTSIKVLLDPPQGAEVIGGEDGDIDIDPGGY